MTRLMGRFAAHTLACRAYTRSYVARQPVGYEILCCSLGSMKRDHTHYCEHCNLRHFRRPMGHLRGTSEALWLQTVRKPKVSYYAYGVHQTQLHMDSIVICFKTIPIFHNFTISEASWNLEVQKW